MRSFTLEPLPQETTPQASRVPRKTWERAPTPIYMMPVRNSNEPCTRPVRIGLASGGLGIHRCLIWRDRWVVSHIASGKSIGSIALVYWQAKRLLDVMLLLGLHFGLSFECSIDDFAKRCEQIGMTAQQWRYYHEEAIGLPRSYKAWRIAAFCIRHHARHHAVKPRPFPDHSPEQRGQS